MRPPPAALLLALAAGCGGVEDVPGDADHGSVRREAFAGGVLGREIACHVYLPPGGPRPGERLPVVYLLHGYGDGPHSWFRWGRAHETADRRLAEILAGLGDRVPHETHLVEGGHSWSLWRERLPHALRFLAGHLRVEGTR